MTRERGKRSPGQHHRLVGGNDAPHPYHGWRMTARKNETPEEKAARLHKNMMRARERREDPAYLERKRIESRNRRLDPAVRARDAAVAERYVQRKRAPPPDHPGTCDCCGVVPKNRSDGRRGLQQDHRHDTGGVRGWVCARCNIQVDVLDFRWTDPDRFVILLAWSNKGAPIRPVPWRAGELTRPSRREVPADHPGTCDCCGTRPGMIPNGEGRARRGLFLDHRHDTGEIRGWLCVRCNKQVAVLDYRWSDPARYAQLLSWSNKGAPMAPMPATMRLRRRDPSDPQQAMFPTK